MPPTEDKRKAARETIDVLYEISSLLVRQSNPMADAPDEQHMHHRYFHFFALSPLGFTY
jgi:hypothetical protein